MDDKGNESRPTFPLNLNRCLAASLTLDMVYFDGPTSRPMEWCSRESAVGGTTDASLGCGGRSQCNTPSCTQLQELNISVCKISRLHNGASSKANIHFWAGVCTGFHSDQAEVSHK